MVFVLQKKGLLQSEGNLAYGARNPNGGAQMKSFEVAL